MTSTAQTASEPPDVSVLVCTKNRASSLRRLLTSLTSLNVPSGVRWELVLIDNGSTDDTGAVAASFAASLPLRYIEHPPPGLCGARNRGVAEAAGTYICWTDDDTTLDPDWLAAYVAAFARYPDASFFGGRITPALDADTPGWIKQGQHLWPLDSILACRDPADKAAPVTLGREPMPLGANWAVLAEALRRHPYDPGLGYAPGRPRIADETDVIYRMLRAGLEGRWVPNAKVRHFVPVERLSWQRIFGHFVMQGATDAYLVERSPEQNWLADRNAPVLSMSHAAVEIRARIHHLRYLCWKAVHQPERAARALARSGYFHGMTAYWNEDKPPAAATSRPAV